MAEDASVGDCREIALEDVEISAADGGGINAHDCVGVIPNPGLVDFFPGLLAGPVVHECLHDRLLNIASIGTAYRSQLCDRTKASADHRRLMMPTLSAANAPMATSAMKLTMWSSMIGLVEAVG